MWTYITGTLCHPEISATMCHIGPSTPKITFPFHFEISILLAWDVHFVDL